MNPAAEIELAWKKERKWFSRTLVSSFVSILCFFALAGLVGWGKKETLRVLGPMGAPLTTFTEQQTQDLLAALGTTIIITYAAMILLILSGLIFLFFLTRWLMAISSRRKAIAAAGGPG